MSPWVFERLLKTFADGSDGVPFAHRPTMASSCLHVATLLESLSASGFGDMEDDCACGPRHRDRDGTCDRRIEHAFYVVPTLRLWPPAESTSRALRRIDIRRAAELERL